LGLGGSQRRGVHGGHEAQVLAPILHGTALDLAPSTIIAAAPSAAAIKAAPVGKHVSVAVRFPVPVVSADVVISTPIVVGFHGHGDGAAAAAAIAATSIATAASSPATHQHGRQGSPLVPRPELRWPSEATAAPAVAAAAAAAVAAAAARARPRRCWVDERVGGVGGGKGRGQGRCLIREGSPRMRVGHRGCAAVAPPTAATGREACSGGRWGRVGAETAAAGQEGLEVAPGSPATTTAAAAAAAATTAATTAAAAAAVRGRVALGEAPGAGAWRRPAAGHGSGDASG